MFRNAIGTLLLTLLMSAPLPAQHLVDDARRLLTALDRVQDTAAEPTARAAAAREALLVLFFYDTPAQPVPPRALDAAQLLARCSSTPLLASVLGPGIDTLLRAADTRGAYDSLWTRLHTPERRRIQTMMYGDAPVSPGQYLSVLEALDRGRLSPLSDTASLRAAAVQVTQVRGFSAFSSEKLLEGLFEFILKRAQEEIVISFFENLLTKKLPPVRAVFPHVSEQFRDARFSYSQSFLSALRQAFFLDLQQLNITLPELLLHDAAFRSLQENPVFFNLLTVYSMFGLASQPGASWDEVLPLTHRGLYERYQAAGDTLNRFLADSATATPEYLKVRQAATEVIIQLDSVYDALRQVETMLNDTFMARFLQGDTALLGLDRRRFLHDSLFTYAVLIHNPDQRSSFELTFLPDLLAGALDDEKLRVYNTFYKYDQLFDPPFTERQLRVAGLELARNLGGAWYNDRSLADLLRNWQTGLAAYEQAVSQYLAAAGPADPAEALAETERQRAELYALIGASKHFWAGRATRSDLQALSFLEAMAADFAGLPATADAAESLPGRRDKLFQITVRLDALERRLGPDTRSPLAAYRQLHAPALASNRIARAIDTLERRLASLQQGLAALDYTRAPQLAAACSRPVPLLQTTELLSQTLFALRAGDRWITLDSLRQALSDPRLGAACIGLFQQRLWRAHSLHLTGRQATGDFLTATLGDLWTLLGPEASDSTLPASERLLRRVSAAQRALCRGLELPLFAAPGQPGVVVSLIQIDTSLRRLPVFSRHCTDFLYYLSLGQHRPAVGAFTRVLQTLNEELAARGLQKKPVQMTRFFERYGDFVGGLVDARSGAEIEHLLTAFANPPGSSRDKRNARLSLGFNAYFGAGLGFERWRMPEGGPTRRFVALTPSIPVGLTLSALAGRMRAHPQSFSLHFVLLDLGTLLSNRFGDDATFGSQKLTFKNVFKPGVQLHWNIPKSPFYIGFGWQSGVEYREENGQEIAFRASRWLLPALGVDVPVQTIFRR